MDRRIFIRNSALVAAATTLGVSEAISAPKIVQFPNIKFGICADLHQDIMHDGPERLQAFITEMNKKKVDFIIQMGDFCRPYDYNKIILDIWKQFKGPNYHVIGNHDTDGGFTRDQVVEYWGAKGKYYSFDLKGYHFIVLDGNEGTRTATRRYPSMFSLEQLEWLEKDLETAKLPVMVFVHQGLDNDGGVENAMKVRYILEQANLKAKTKKVHLVFSGHHHCDYYNVINGIHYIQINSMSYHFMGKKYMKPSYSEDILQKHPKLLETTPYKDPLWATIEVQANGNFTMTGKKSQFVGPSPRERGKNRLDDIYPGVSFISDHKFNLNGVSNT